MCAQRCVQEEQMTKKLWGQSINQYVIPVLQQLGFFLLLGYRMEVTLAALTQLYFHSAHGCVFQMMTHVME